MKVCSIYLDADGQQYDILHNQELTYNQCAKVVSNFKPSYVIHHPKADVDVFVIQPDEKWIP